MKFNIEIPEEELNKLKEYFTTTINVLDSNCSNEEVIKLLFYIAPDFDVSNSVKVVKVKEDSLQLEKQESKEEE